MATHLTLVKPGDVVIGASASHSHPSVVRAAGHVGARFIDTAGIAAFRDAIATERSVGLVVLTRLAVTYDLLPLEAIETIVRLAHDKGAVVYNTKTKTCDPRLVGLVGLHVVMKTKQLPQWLWATLEQVDNAPDEGAPVVPGKKYNFNNPACTNCPVNVPPGAGDQTPTQVVRVVPVDSAALGTNSLYQAALHGLRRTMCGNTTSW
jgi:hypothetical protein